MQHGRASNYTQGTEKFNVLQASIESLEQVLAVVRALYCSWWRERQGLFE